MQRYVKKRIDKANRQTLFEGKYLLARELIVITFIMMLGMTGCCQVYQSNYQMEQPSLAEYGNLRSLVSLDIDSASAVIVYTDDGFDTSVWTGNGTIDNPYVLANKSIDDSPCILIEDTRNYFRIENCTLKSSSIGIHLVNVTNAIIRGNSIEAYSSGIELDESSDCEIIKNEIKSDLHGILISSSEHCLLKSNSIFHCYDDGLTLSRCSHLSIKDNLFLGSSFEAWRADNCSIFNNTIASNEVAVELTLSVNNSIIGNRLATVEGSIAIDNGANNTWDDGISIGNAWLDYVGTGEYQISGLGNSIDHFPTKFSPSFPMDFDGPSIIAPLGFLCIDYIDEIPDSYRLTATVTDPSGVDTVIITVNGVSHVMNYLPSTENPDYYVYDHPNPSFMTYSYWANDSLGLSSATEMGFISLGVFQGNSSNPDVRILYVTMASLLVLFIAVIALLRESRSK
ncbi:MAG: NosD domain-containing protein [Candidatus Odinarchaeota archaeon]